MPLIKTRACIHCGKTGELELTEEEITRMQTMLIQQALPDRDVGFREQIITGTHPDCWDAMFPPEDELEDDMSYADVENQN